MSYRFMRILLFYDLPTTTAFERRLAQDFRKNLVKEGFLMLQESVYCKLVLNNTVMVGVRNKIEKIKPKNGSIMLLIVTEKQFSSMEIILGTKQSTVIDKDNRLLIL